MLDLDAYLERIGLHGAPTIAQVHRAHVTSIPFENLDPHRGVPMSASASAACSTRCPGSHPQRMRAEPVAFVANPSGVAGRNMAMLRGPLIFLDFPVGTCADRRGGTCTAPDRAACGTVYDRDSRPI
jgi:hypothetical protein